MAVNLGDVFLLSSTPACLMPLYCFVAAVVITRCLLFRCVCHFPLFQDVFSSQDGDCLKYYALASVCFSSGIISICFILHSLFSLKQVWCFHMYSDSSASLSYQRTAARDIRSTDMNSCHHLNYSIGLCTQGQP